MSNFLKRGGFEIRYCCVAQAVLELAVLLPYPKKVEEKNVLNHLVLFFELGAYTFSHSSSPFL
jgi:hypothetical protein